MLRAGRSYKASSFANKASEVERRLIRRVIAGIGSAICFGGTAFRRMRRDWSSLVPLSLEPGKTMPGESISLSFLSSLTSRREVVTPASAPVGQAAADPPRRPVSALMTEDLPTLGYPMTPTETERFSCFECAKDFSAFKRAAEVPCTVSAL